METHAFSIAADLKPAPLSKNQLNVRITNPVFEDRVFEVAVTKTLGNLSLMSTTKGLRVRAADFNEVRFLLDLRKCDGLVVNVADTSQPEAIQSLKLKTR